MCRNQELYDYIINNYTNAEKPVSQQEIADAFGISIGGVKNFMFRHKLNKKTYYAKQRKEIRGKYKKGYSIPELAKIYDTSAQNIYIIVREV